MTTLEELTKTLEKTNLFTNISIKGELNQHNTLCFEYKKNPNLDDREFFNKKENLIIQLTKFLELN